MIEDPGREARAQEGLNAVTLLLLGGWVKRWGIILVATLVFGLLEPQLMPLFYGALAFAGLTLLLLFGARRAISNKLARGAPHTIDAEAEEIIDEPNYIDVTPKEKE